jgi:hypothetical protein
MAGLEGRLGEGVVVRSDDIVGNEVMVTVWLPGGGEEQKLVALFTDDCELVELRSGTL